MISSNDSSEQVSVLFLGRRIILAKGAESLAPTVCRVAVRPAMESSAAVHDADYLPDQFLRLGTGTPPYVFLAEPAWITGEDIGESSHNDKGSSSSTPHVGMLPRTPQIQDISILFSWRRVIVGMTGCGIEAQSVGQEGKVFAPLPARVRVIFL